MSGRPWKIGDEELICQTPIFSLCKRTMTTPTEYTGDFYYLKSSDWVNVIPLTDDGRVVMIKQFRANVGRYFLELPGGIVDPNEALDLAGARELQEETGYTADSYEHLASVRPNPAVHSNECHYYIARGAKLTREPNREPHEDITVELFPINQLPQMVVDGKFDHALMLSALLQLFIREKLF